MPLRIATPSPTSRLYGAAAEALNRLLGTPPAPHGRVLLESLADGSQLVYCRATDVGVLVALGVADVGLTGYDMVAEATANGRPTPMIRSLAPARTSYVCLVKPERRTHVTRIYTEYPYLTRAWLGRSHLFGGAEVVTLHGSIEGVIALSPPGRQPHLPDLVPQSRRLDTSGSPPARASPGHGQPRRRGWCRTVPPAAVPLATRMAVSRRPVPADGSPGSPELRDQ